jgi:hypothetical protein
MERVVPPQRVVMERVITPLRVMMNRVLPVLCVVMKRVVRPSRGVFSFGGIREALSSALNYFTCVTNVRQILDERANEPMHPDNRQFHSKIFLHRLRTIAKMTLYISQKNFKIGNILQSR